jgi:arylsulfatase A-like enzyme
MNPWKSMRLWTTVCVAAFCWLAESANAAFGQVLDKQKLLVGAASPLPAREKKPNILFILSDDQRFDALGCAGHPIVKTPNLDRLAARGVRFRNSFVTTPICAASRASILTGLYERTHKFTFGTPPLAASFCEGSYPFLLRRAGYRTALIGKFGVSVDAGQASKMFDLLVPIGYPFQRKQKAGASRHIDQIATDRAVEFLKEQPAQQPFCLSISFNSPHAEDGKLDNLYPWPKTVDGLYDDVRIPTPPLAHEKHFQAEPEFLRKSLNRIRWYWQFDTPEKYAKNVRAYYRMISGIDHEIGRLLAELERLGLADNTVVVFMSDNGYFLGERGFSGKWVHYEESLRVPLLIADPRLPAERRGKTADEMALNLDIAPTLLSLAGLDIPKEYQGRSLLSPVRGDNKGWRTDFFCEHLFVHPDIPQWEGVRGRRYVYARYFTQRPAYEFLHDLKEDPHELKNLAREEGHTALLERMRRRLEELRDANGGPYVPERFPILPKKKK